MAPFLEAVAHIMLITFCIFCNNGEAFWTMQLIQTMHPDRNAVY